MFDKYIFLNNGDV